MGESSKLILAGLLVIVALLTLRRGNKEIRIGDITSNLNAAPELQTAEKDSLLSLARATYSAMLGTLRYNCYSAGGTQRSTAGTDRNVWECVGADGSVLWSVNIPKGTEFYQAS